MLRGRVSVICRSLVSILDCSKSVSQCGRLACQRMRVLRGAEGGGGPRGPASPAMEGAVKKLLYGSGVFRLCAAEKCLFGARGCV